MNKSNLKGIFNFSSRSLGRDTFKYLGGDKEIYTSGGLEALKALRSSNKRADIKHFREMAYNYGYVDVFKIEHTDPKQIFTSLNLRETTLKNEIEWCLGYILQYKNILIEYLSTKNFVYCLEREGSLEEAIGEIHDFFKNFGYSLSFLEMLFYMLNEAGGLERQKAYRAELNTLYPKTFISWYGAAMSQRTEGSLPFETYRSKILVDIHKWKIDSKHSKFYSYRLAGVNGYSDESASEILLVHSSTTPFDLYEYLLDLYQSYPAYFTQEFKSLIEDINSSALFSGEAALSIKSINSEIDDLDVDDESERDRVAKRLMFLRWLPEKMVWLKFLYFVSNIPSEWKYCKDILMNSNNDVIRSEDYINKRIIAMDAFVAGDFDASAQATAEIGTRNSRSVETLPIFSLGQKILKDGLKDDFIKTVILDFFNKKYDDSKAKLKLKWFFEDAVEASGYDKPSQMLANTDLQNSTAAYFFAEVCSISNLSFLDAFSTSREVDDERLSICSLLINYEPERFSELKEEITSIVTKNTVADGMQMVDQSRIYVDIDAIQKWASINLRDVYKRFIALVKNIKVSEDVSPEKDFFDLLDDRAELLKYFEVSNDEAGDILKTIIFSLREKFLFDPEYGLNSFLSMRIRHGTLSGTLKGPLSEYRLLNVKDRDGEFKTDPDLIKMFSSQSDQKTISDALRNFTIEYNRIIDEQVIPLFYVRSHEHPLGMIKLTITENMLTALRVYAKDLHELTYYEFFENIISYFKLIISEELQEIANYISGIITDKINICFAELTEELNSISFEHRDNLKSVIMNARSDTSQALTTVLSWLTMSDDKSIDTLFSLQQAANIAINSAFSVTRGFSPEIELNIDKDAAEIGVTLDIVRQIADIMYIVIDNAAKHSNNTEPQMAITLKLRNEHLRFVIISQMNYLPTESQVSSVEEIRAMIDSGNYSNRVINEGKSGLVKIKNILNFYKSHTFLFGYSENAFYIEIEFSPRLIGAQ